MCKISLDHCWSLFNNPRDSLEQFFKIPTCNDMKVERICKWFKNLRCKYTKILPKNFMKTINNEKGEKSEKKIYTF